ncbi:Nucleotide-binding alpha-beta plait [Penicillium angulare]|uniref:Nucleotide-binding alpha-beta plait n=1 Tax=Penicillium angulare TaxID=116970 RepID=A0A9W9EUH9_9EURO|nr:Nucleotide-binding alpha-beta plait [Penicillium angulare]
MTEHTRLHIIPLTPDLLPSVLPPSVRSAATDISFHTIPTFPENNYGYVTLPTMEAEKIKKKLNGMILKGKKFKIETARPQKRQIEEEEADPAPTKEKRKSKKHKSEDKKDKKDKQALEGYEIPSDRKVKRGWTDPNSGKRDKHNYDKDKKKSKEDKKSKPQPKSKYSENPECLFRTSIPANRVSQTEDDKKAKKNKKTPDNVVHEFAKTYTHPSFLREKGDDSVPTTQFDEEKGWIDSTGTVKEPPSEKARKKDYRPGSVPGAKEKRPIIKVRASKTQAEDPESSAESDDYTSSSGSSDESSDSESESEDENENESEADSSSDDSDSSNDEEESDKQETPKKSTKTTDDDTMDVDDSKPEVAYEPAQDADESSPKEVHPLEALFKRPAAPAEAEEQTEPKADAGFSFFGNADDIESEDEPRSTEPQPPLTPYNKRELQDRGLRSAAPTPDTALASRHMKYMEDDDEEEDEEEVSFDTPVSKSRETDGKKDETEFAKWFWENRGDNNRAWKKRRRDAAKEQRQRDNRKKGMKGRS